MTKPNIQKALITLFQLTIFFLYCYLRIDNANIIQEPRSFGDTPEYMHIASLSILSTDFWSESKPPVTSAFWKMVDSKPEGIFALQLILSILCWGTLALTASSTAQSHSAKLITFIIVLAFSLSEHIIMWDPFLGSESIAISITALFLASVLWILSGWRVQKALLLIATIFLLAFTKDASAYFLFLLSALITRIFWFTHFRKQAVSILLIIALILLSSSYLAAKGSRRYRVFLTTTAFRIFPSPEYTKYFKSRGMPINEELVDLSKNLKPGNRYEVVHALYDDPKFTQWAFQNSWDEYKKFLWLYKADVLQSVFLETPHESFAPDVKYLTATGYHDIITDPHLKEILYPLKFGVIYFYLANLCAAAFLGYAYQNKKKYWSIPLLIILSTYPQAILVWAADALDIARHSIVFNIFFRLGVWLLFLFIADDFLCQLKEKFRLSLI